MGDRRAQLDAAVQAAQAAADEAERERQENLAAVEASVTDDGWQSLPPRWLDADEAEGAYRPVVRMSFDRADLGTLIDALGNVDGEDSVRLLGVLHQALDHQAGKHLA